MSLRFDVRTCIVCCGLVGASVVIAAVTLTTGDYPVSLPDVVRTLLGSGTETTHFIVETLRQAVSLGAVALTVLILLFSPAALRWAGGDQRGPASSANGGPDSR